MIIQKVEKSRLETLNKDNLSFGAGFTDHMFICEYKDGKWGEPRLIPYGKLEFSPALMVAHYGQGCFEGMKAYKDKDDNVFLFRPEKNFERINKSAKRLAIPELPKEIFMEGLKALVDVDRDWVPYGEGYSLYIRPVIFATEEALKARPSDEYMFAILATPVKSYDDGTLAAKIETTYSRAASGGVGYAKAAGNYAGAFYPTKLANEEGYQQIIWTDDATHQYIEECNTVNVFVRIEDTIYTAKTSDKILDGVTRDSILKLAEKRNYKVEVGNIAVEKIVSAHKNGTLKEVWGVGTAVVTSVFEALGYNGQRLELPKLSEEESFALTLKRDLTDIQTNKTEDPFGWRVLVEPKL